MGADIHEIAADIRLKIERSEAGLFKFIRSCEIEEEDNGGNFFCSTSIDGATVHLLTSNQSIRVIRGDRRAVQHVDIDSALLFEACKHVFRSAEGERAHCDE